MDDISSKTEYKVALEAGVSEEEAMEAVRLYSRDNARKPMQWNGTSHGGFTTGTPWLKENPNYRQINVEEQKERGDSVFQFYRSLIALRKNPDYEDSLIYGACIPYLREQKNLMAYLRKKKVKGRGSDTPSLCYYYTTKIAEIQDLYGFPVRGIVTFTGACPVNVTAYAHSRSPEGDGAYALAP